MQCIAVLPTNKVKASPPTQQGDFQHHIALKSVSKPNIQRSGKDKGEISLIFQPSFLFLSNCKFSLFVVTSSSLFITKTGFLLSSDSVKKYGFVPAAFYAF